MASYQFIVLFVVYFSATVLSKPLDISEKDQDQLTPISAEQPHSLEKRFINPSLTLGSFADIGFNNIRTKRSEDECEKLHLCKLHARSSSNFFAAFQLYFVNKENARLWDHRSHSAADCEKTFSGCYYK